MRGGADAGRVQPTGRSCLCTTDACARRSDAGADPRPRFVAMARWYRGANELYTPRRATPHRLRRRLCARASPSTGQQVAGGLRTRAPTQYLEKRRVATCPGHPRDGDTVHFVISMCRLIGMFSGTAPPSSALVPPSGGSPASHRRRALAGGRRQRRVCSGVARASALPDLLPTRRALVRATVQTMSRTSTMARRRP